MANPLLSFNCTFMELKCAINNKLMSNRAEF